MIMKNQLTKVLIASTLLFTTTLAKAQLDIDIDINESKWYEDPKVWVGVGLFLVVLAFIARSKKS